MKPTILIIGAGLGGSYIAAGLTEFFNIKVVELANQRPLLRDRIRDISRSGLISPLAESGLGGTTKVWHNALMEINEDIFRAAWPFPKYILDPYYELAYLALSGFSKPLVCKTASLLRGELVRLGVPEFLLNQSMLIPEVRLNAWQALNLGSSVTIIEGEAIELIPKGLDAIGGIRISTPLGCEEIIDADYFILAAGGLGSPPILQQLAKRLPLTSLTHSGKNYEDHPMAFIGEITLERPLYRLWNFPIRGLSKKANLRLPLSFFLKGLNISFQLRPAHHFRFSKPRRKLTSVLTELRNHPFNLINYLKLLKSLDDILDILSIKMGLNFPTKKYSVLMIAEQPPSLDIAVSGNGFRQSINRQWDISDDYIEILNEAIDHFLLAIQEITIDFNPFLEWPKHIASSAHHSGTNRMSESEQSGVCDLNGKVHGLENLFICDGSVIPRSGFVNTGLTIVALSMRMADFLISLKGKTSES